MLLFIHVMCNVMKAWRGGLELRGNSGSWTNYYFLSLVLQRRTETGNQVTCSKFHSIVRDEQKPDAMPLSN